MTNFISDFFYRFNCVSPVNTDFSFKLPENVNSKFLILPYGKNSFCSNLCESAYSLFPENVKTIFLLIPTYNYCSEGLLSFTPEVLDEISFRVDVMNAFLDEISNHYPMEYFDFQIEKEEILFPHLDCINNVRRNFKIVPLLFNDIREGVFVDIIERYGYNSGFVLVSNLSRGFGYRDACMLDNFTASNVEKNEIKDISYESFTAFKILPEVLGFSDKQGHSYIRLGLGNSAEFSANCASTAGYGAWFAYKGKTIEYIEKFFSSQIIDFVRFNLFNGLHLGCGQCFDFPDVFNQDFKVFVWLEKNGFVRGVSGSYRTPEPLYKALVKRTFGAAFSDNRFAPLKPEDLDGLRVGVTLLGKALEDFVCITFDF